MYTVNDADDFGKSIFLEQLAFGVDVAVAGGLKLCGVATLHNLFRVGELVGVNTSARIER